MKHLALCQNCLRVAAFANYTDVHGVMCACGDGPFEDGLGYCPCAGCEQAAVELMAGGRCSETVSGLMPGVVLKSWTAHEGAVFA